MYQLKAMFTDERNDDVFFLIKFINFILTVNENTYLSAVKYKTKSI